MKLLSEIDMVRKADSTYPHRDRLKSRDYVVEFRDKIDWWKSCLQDWGSDSAVEERVKDHRKTSRRRKVSFRSNITVSMAINT